MPPLRKTGLTAVTTFCLMALGLLSPASAEELKFTAEELWRQAVPQRIALTEDGGALALERGELYEDDGPSAGFSYLPNLEKLTPEIAIKKVLVVDRPAADSARFLIARGGDISVAINGRQAKLESLGKTGNYWTAYRFDPKLLVAGENEFVVQGTGEVWIARDDERAAGTLDRRAPPNRSQKSADGGKTWTDNQLGATGDIDGEYNIRLHLDHFLAEGTLVTPVVDLGNLAGRTVAPPVSAIKQAQASVQANSAGAGSVSLAVRYGTTLSVDDQHWSAWQDLSSTNAALAPGQRRFVQFRVTLATTDPLRSPQLSGLTISADVIRPADWTQSVKLAEQQRSGPLVRSAMPFSYERWDHPRLAQLRKRHRLDEVVGDAQTELEVMTRLARWSSQAWPKLGHLKEIYPAWDSLAILAPHADGTPIGGFCNQYNLVFLQACQSFGIVGRIVSIGPGDRTEWIRGGHETVELWSNQLGRWVYFDGNTAWYVVDAESRQLLSLREMRNRQLAMRLERPSPDVEVVKITPTRYEWKGLLGWPALVEMRIVPRNDFLSNAAPLPLNQGMRGWFWTGHYVWSDRQQPPRAIYSHHITRPGDWEWDVNCCHLLPVANEEPGNLIVQIDTHTPGLESLLVSRDGGPAERIDPALSIPWQLHAGENRLQVVSRNSAGRTGVPAVISLQYDPAR